MKNPFYFMKIDMAKISPKILQNFALKNHPEIIWLTRNDWNNIWEQMNLKPEHGGAGFMVEGWFWATGSDRLTIVGAII